jgi:uncharacterized protein
LNNRAGVSASRFTALYSLLVPVHVFLMFSPLLCWGRRQVLHGCARRTAVVRRAIQNSQEGLNELAEQYGINSKTAAEWKKRTFADDAPTGPKEVRSTTSSPARRLVHKRRRFVEKAPPTENTLAVGARATPILPPAERLLMSTFRFPLPPARLAFIAALPLAIGTSLSIAHAQQVLSLKDSVPSITTNGVASTDAVPDIATISLGVDTERPNAANAARDNARAAQAIVGEIKAQGIEAKDIKTLSVTLAPVYDEVIDANGRSKRTLRGYIAHNSLSVRVREIEKAGTLAGQLMDKGANSFDGIEFDYSQEEAKYDALRGDAVRDALRKANSYVTGLGLKLGRVLEIATHAPYPVPTGMSPKMLGAAKREATAAVPVEPGVEMLRTEVRVTWELAQ